jgi:hypothetical protein
MVTAIRTDLFVVLQRNEEEPSLMIFEQWLVERGHHVRWCDSADAAITAATAGWTDLLVLAPGEHSAQVEAIDRMGLMPAAHRPKHVAILADEEPDATLRRRLPGVKLALIGEPIHALGLLDVAKRIVKAKRKA